MPKRFQWPWDRSPLRGKDAYEQYEALRWGNAPRRVFEVQSPALTRKQLLVSLGRLRALFLGTGRQARALRPRKPYPYLVVGELDNRLYIVGGSTDRMARDGAWGEVGSRRRIVQVDYDSLKGSTDAYFYHEHEPPFPWLVILSGGYPAYRGGRYKVGPEGIVG